MTATRSSSRGDVRKRCWRSETNIRLTELDTDEEISSTENRSGAACLALNSREPFVRRGCSGAFGERWEHSRNNYITKMQSRITPS
ncbi:hypothetical protein FOZ60_011206 [Perkinsus olseni]|uniref:Uncharacterized protein n=1 Tax=Perkinsus olseni TaxID=32597 RepID=A0A7J6NDT3_PEROL|nr:hypothetical protein FOZ60_011206 [Perkinsus olseni]